MIYTLRLSTRTGLNGDYDKRTAPVVGECRTIREAREMARGYGDENAVFRLVKGGKLDRYLRADGSDY